VAHAGLKGFLWNEIGYVSCSTGQLQPQQKKIASRSPVL